MQLQTICKLIFLVKKQKLSTFASESLTENQNYTIMKHFKTHGACGLLALLLMALLHASDMRAQAKVEDKEIVGVWIMTSLKFEGEDKEYISDNYTQVKVYRANGEYACAEVVRLKDGSYLIAPHEYGTYSLKNGMYSEMGRKPIKYKWVDKTTSRGRWMNRIDEWKKLNTIPEKLTQHIVDKCKAAQQEPKDIQVLMKKFIFGK